MMRGVVTLVVFALLVGLGIWAFLDTHEQKEITIPVYPQAEAWRDPFLAAGRLLKKFDVASRELVGLESERHLAPNAVVVIPAPRGMLSDGALAHWRAAVAGGAHLVVESERVGVADPLLDAFGVQREARNAKACSTPTAERYAWIGNWRTRLETSQPTSPVLADVTALGAPALKVSVYGGEQLSAEADPAWQVQACDGVRVLHLNVGAGRVTAVNDITFAGNWAIARDDNAEFFWRLVNAGGTPAEVVFVTAAQSGLMPWLAEHAWRVLILLGVFVALWLWSMIPRFGPIRPDPEPVRRRLVDHLRANGRLLWSLGAREALAQSARAGVLARLHQAHPHVRSLERSELETFLAKRYRLPQDWAALIAGEGALGSPQRFVALARACRALHRALRGNAAAHDTLYDLTPGDSA